MITVFADQYLYKIASCLPKSIDLHLFDPAEGLPEDLHRAHGLLIRTVNAINPETLPDIPDNLSFIGTGSSGTDHVDQSYLDANDITFADAAGCNARSVAEYIATGLLIWSEQEQKSLHDLSVGIIGVGHVGTQVRQLLAKLDIPTVGYDPPRAKRDPGFTSASLQQVLNTDILSFHTPLTTEGDHPTYHWLDRDKLSNHRFELILNTARGGVVDEEALLEAHHKGRVNHFILDVWEDEPKLHLQTATEAFLKTPHIAGYSIEAKQNASQFVADALLKHFDLDHKEQPVENNIQQVDAPVSHYSSLAKVMEKVHPIKKYETELRSILRNEAPMRGTLFNKLRAEFPLRHEFSHIRLPKSYFKRFPVLEKLGFKMQETGCK